MKDIYTKIQEVIASGQPAALCVVVDTKGSTPRKAGAKMIVFGDGKIFGTIGGGNIEFTVTGEALGVISSGKSKLLSYDLGTDLGMKCNGKATVFIEPLFGNLVLYLFGAGHVNRALYKYARDFGFKVTLFDERAGIEDDQAYKDAVVVVKPYEESIADAVFDDRTFVVVATPGHATDEIVLKACLRRPHAYLGMIGSKAKVINLRKNLTSSNFATEEELAPVHMPIGIPFASVTAEEIAISILAELIDCKNSMF